VLLLMLPTKSFSISFTSHLSVGGLLTYFLDHSGFLTEHELYGERFHYGFIIEVQ
jgi:hypothetical protein